MTIPAGYAQVAHLFEGAAVPRGATTTYGVLLVAGMTPTQVAGDLHDKFAPIVTGNMTTEVSLVRTVVKFGPDATGATGEHADTIPGAVAAATVPPTVAALVHKFTNSGGRKNRGRMFLPGLPEANVGGNGVLTDNARTALQADLDLFLAEIESGSGTVGDMVILHDPDKFNVTSAPTTVTDLSCSPLIATVRNRLR